MPEQKIRFEDGTLYERYMGQWSRLAGDVLLDWLAPSPGWRWADIGCGTGAFSQLLVDRCAPAAVDGVDPSEAQLAFARGRPAARLAHFRQGDAMALPFADATFDAAVMALVIFFVPQPAKGVAEMRRVLRPGGVAAAYAWDIEQGGIPAEPILGALRDGGFSYPLPPSPAASRIDALRDLWRGAGLVDVDTCAIAVTQTFADFGAFWETHRLLPMIRDLLAGMSAGEIEELKDRTRARLSTDAAGRITVTGRANAVKGRAPA